MKDHLYHILLFILMFHFSTGCIVSDNQQTKHITGYTGASVLLPCSCADLWSTATTFTWEFKLSDRYIQVFKEEKYSGRHLLFNQHSPANLSLLISDLRMIDGGYYKCKIDTNSYTYVNLKVKGCDLVEDGKTFKVTGYSGDSVVLSCSCAELLTKPQQMQWMYYIENNPKEIYPNEQIEKYKNRVKLFNPNTPGDLSLQISALTSQDQGEYQCVSFIQAVAFRLTVLHAEEKPRVHTTSLSTPQPSHHTQELPSQSHHTPQVIDVFIVVAVFSVLLLLAFLALSSRYGEDEVTCSESDVVYVKMTSTPAHAQNDTVELAEYINDKNKLT